MDRRGFVGLLLIHSKKGAASYLILIKCKWKIKKTGF